MEETEDRPLRRARGQCALGAARLLVMLAAAGATLCAQPVPPAPHVPGTARDLHERDSLLQATIANAPSAAAPLDLLLPASMRVAYLTRQWVRDSLPETVDSTDDLLQLDRIYVRALAESEGDHGLAIFAAFVACLETRNIPFSFGLRIPLAFEPSADYDRRVNRLPRHLFVDLPAGDDRDKLQHFFASAWLTWKLDDPEAADLIGLGVEKGEDAFITGGADDPRDMRANRLGQLFVVLLHARPAALPSMLFAAWNREYLRRGAATKP